MRGPGPKTLSKLGEMYRAETQDVLEERLPEKWVALIRAFEEIASLVENAVSRRCWWRNGMLYCSRYAYAPEYRQSSPARSGIEIMLGIGY